MGAEPIEQNSVEAPTLPKVDVCVNSMSQALADTVISGELNGAVASADSVSGPLEDQGDEVEDRKLERRTAESLKVSTQHVEQNWVETPTLHKQEMCLNSRSQPLADKVISGELDGSVASTDSVSEPSEDQGDEVEDGSVDQEGRTAERLKMEAEPIVRTSVGALRHPKLQISIDSVSQSFEDTVSSGGSSASLDSIDSVTETMENTACEIAEMRRIFQTFDEDQDNFICVTDLRHFMSRLGFDISEKEAEAMVQTVDRNGDGKVALDEFCTLYQQSLNNGAASSEGEEQTSDEDDSIHQAFRVFDKNGDGVITAKELQVVLLGMGRPEGKSLQNCERMIRGVNADGSERVDIRMFKYMMSPKFHHK